MKIIITESKLERLGINWLNDNFGDLETYKTERYENVIFFIVFKDYFFTFSVKNLVGIFFRFIWLQITKVIVQPINSKSF